MIDVLFTGEEPHLEFVECEDGDGHSINAGEWRIEGDYKVLRIKDWHAEWETATALHMRALAELETLRGASLKGTP